MTQKEDIESMLASGKGYDEIEDNTGSTRSYIRSLAVGYRKKAGEGEAPPAEGRQENTPPITPQTPPAITPPVATPGMNFIDDRKPPAQAGDAVTGLDHHKAWVKAGKYECGVCGCTIGRTTKFCPHCGEILVWEGIE